MLPGDGIGPEMMGYVREVFRYAGAPVDFEEICFDPNSEEEADFYNAITSIKRNGVAIKGNLKYFLQWKLLHTIKLLLAL